MNELTPRECEVAECVARGLSNDEIARELHIAAGTAAIHVRNVLFKTGLRSRSHLAAWAVSSGIARPVRIDGPLPCLPTLPAELDG